MKNIRDIGLSVQNRSFEQKLAFNRSLLRLKLTLPQRLRESVRFMYVKEKTLFFVLDHPALVMEFNYNHLSLIKDLLTKFDFEGLGDIKSVKCFATNKIKSDDTQDSSNTYTEHSKGTFKNHLQDDRLKAKVEEIREVICSLKN